MITAGELSYAINKTEDGQWECRIYRFIGGRSNWPVIAIGKHKSVTGALHTAQQMALDVLSAPTQTSEKE